VTLICTTTRCALLSYTRRFSTCRYFVLRWSVVILPTGFPYCLFYISDKRTKNPLDRGGLYCICGMDTTWGQKRVVLRNKLLLFVIKIVFPRRQMNKVVPTHLVQALSSTTRHSLLVWLGVVLRQPGPWLQWRAGTRNSTIKQNTYWDTVKRQRKTFPDA
jgi:hypothetical protein